MKSFLDGVNPPPGCPLSCHDSNHNGDDVPGAGCGNPRCWKHDESSPPPKPMKPKDFRCTCDGIDVKP